MKSKKTAVEWLVEKLQNNEDISKESPYINSLLRQAKEMEKEQMMAAVDVGFEEGSKFPEDIKLNNAEEYYNQIYGK